MTQSCNPDVIFVLSPNLNFNQTCAFKQNHNLDQTFLFYLILENYCLLLSFMMSEPTCDLAPIEAMAEVCYRNEGVPSISKSH